MSKIRTTDISPGRSSRSLGKVFAKTEQQTWNCEVYLFRMPQPWWDNSETSYQNYNHVDVSWKNRYLEVFDGASKEKANIPEKFLKIQTKDNQDMPWWIYKYSFLEETFYIIQKPLPNFKLLKTVGIGFMIRETHTGKFWFPKNLQNLSF